MYYENRFWWNKEVVLYKIAESVLLDENILLFSWSVFIWAAANQQNEVCAYWRLRSSAWASA